MRSGLVGRAAESAAVERLLAAATDRAGRVVVIRGGAGVGKTALLETAAGQAQADEFTVLMARGSGYEQELRYGLVSRLFEPVLPELADLGLTAVFEREARVPGQDASLAELRTLHRALVCLATRAPVLVAVDDLQWLDRPSLRWLSTLPQRVERSRVAVIASVCPGEPCAHPDVLEELIAAGPAELHPTDLGKADTARVLARGLGAAPDPAFVRACAQATGGNPLLLTALVEALVERGIAPTSGVVPALADLDLPGLTAAIHVRLRRMSPYALDIVRAVVVLGADATAVRVAEIAGIGLPTVVEVAMTLSRAGLLRAEADTLGVTYPLMERLIVEESPFAVLGTLRADSARLLYQSGAALDRVADHLVGTPPLAQAWVPAALAGAARAALGRGTPGPAVGYVQRALLEPLPDAARAPLLADLSRAESYFDLGAAIRHLQEATVHCGHSVSPEVRAELVPLLAMAGQHRMAVELTTAAGDHLQLAELELSGDLAELELRGNAAELELRGNAELELRRADAVPASDADEGRLLSLLATRAMWAGQPSAEAVTMAHKALAVLPVDLDHAAALLRCALVLAYAGQVEEADVHCATVRGYAERAGHQPWLAAARSARAVVVRLRGRLSSAVEEARAGLELIVACGVGRRDGVAVEFLARLVDILVDLGDYAEAMRCIEHAELTGEVPDTWAGAALLLARGRLRVATGRPAQGLADLMAAGSRLRTVNVANPAVAPWRLAITLALHALGRRSEALRQIAEGVEQARQWAAPGPLGTALRIQGIVLGGPSGLAGLAESVLVLEGSTAILEQARSCTAYGVALSRAGRVVAARQVLHVAFDLAEQCGCGTLAERARVELFASGGRPRRARPDGVAGLTAAELRAARLAAAGKTNREIAKLLFVERRTVEIHLTNTYRKLGIAGRGELATAMHDTA